MIGMQALRTGARRAANKLGYEVFRVVGGDGNPVDDLEIYRRVYSEESIAKRRFYNVGAGLFRHPAWTNVDNPSDWYPHQDGGQIAFDLLSLERMPLEDGVGEAFFSSHVVEHITNAAAENLFREAYRALKPGGFVRITTPNIDLEYRALQANDADVFYWRERSEAECKRTGIRMPPGGPSLKQIFLHHIASTASTLHVETACEKIDDAEFDRVFASMPRDEALDYCTVALQRKYPGNHVNWWSEAKMRGMLERAGFSQIYRSAYGQSFSPAMRNVRYFDATHPKISLYMEAIK